MRRYLFPVVLLLLFTILQTTIVPQLGGILRQADLFLCLTIAYALLQGPTEGAVFGLGTGVLRAIVSGPALGIYAVPLYIIGYCVGQFSLIVYRNSVLVPFVVGLVTTASYWLLMTLMTGGLYGFWIGGGFWLTLPMSLLVNGVITSAIYALVRNRGQGEAVGGRG